MNLSPGKYNAPVVVSHTVRDSAKGNVGIHVVFLVDPGDGAAAEEITADIWLMKNAGAEVNDRSLKSLAILGADLSVGLERLLLDLSDSNPPKLHGHSTQLDCQIEAGSEVLDENGAQKVDPKTGEPLFYKDKLKVAWINEIGASPVETMEPEKIKSFSSGVSNAFAAAAAKLGARGLPRKPTQDQIAARSTMKPEAALTTQPTTQPASAPAATQPTQQQAAKPAHQAGASEDVF